MRFYDLPGHALSYDEALAEVIPNTRGRNFSPILYPLILYAVRKVESSALRLVSAAAIVLAVAAMLFLLPRLGISREAAFLAGPLATVSPAAKEHAQNAREYSVAVLQAVLMTVSLLWYLRDGRKAVLCLSLFLVPLLQYGLSFAAVLSGIGQNGLGRLRVPVDARQYLRPASRKVIHRVDMQVGLEPMYARNLPTPVVGFLSRKRHHATSVTATRPAAVRTP